MVYLALYPRFYVSEQVSVKLNKPWQVSLQRDTQLDGSTRELRRCSIKQSAVAAQHCLTLSGHSRRAAADWMTE